MSNFRHEVSPFLSFLHYYYYYYYYSSVKLEPGTLEEKLLIGSAWNFTYILGTIMRRADRKFSDLDQWPWPPGSQGHPNLFQVISRLPFERMSSNFFSRLPVPLDITKRIHIVSVCTCARTRWRPLPKITFSRIFSQLLHIEAWFKITDIGFEGQRFYWCRYFFSARIT